MASLSALLAVCPNGAWLPEERAVGILGLNSKEALQQKFRSGSLPHVHVEHGSRVDVPEPYRSKRFFFIQKEGTSAGTPIVGLSHWVKICTANPSSIDASTAELIKKYTSRPDPQQALREIQSVKAVVSPSDLPGEVAPYEGYSYGTSGGRVPSKAAGDDSEIYTRADGKKVRRVKRASSAAASLTSLQGFLSGNENKKGESKLAKLSGSKSVVGDGEVYVRADGKKVRRVKKPGSSMSVASEDTPKKSLDGFFSNEAPSKPRVGGSASVAGDMLAVSRDASLTGEVYVRADGKKVRRVKKPAGSDDNVEIITRPDGTKVRRIKKSTLAEGSDDHSESGNGLSGFLQKSVSSEPKKTFSGSHSVGGDQHLEGEIYVRPDGKKVRRVRKAKPPEEGSSLSGLLESGNSSKPNLGGSATVAGDSSGLTPSEETEVEIVTRPDGTKVRRIKRTASKPAEAEEPSSPQKSPQKEKKTLGGFLSRAVGGRPMVGGSASVAGDQLAISKDASLTGEIYVRADGKKVRRVKKSAAEPGDNVEIITRPDGTKVRRIKKGSAKPNEEEESKLDDGGLSGFLDSQPKILAKGAAATVGGDLRSKSENNIADDPATNTEGTKKSLDGFLGNMTATPKKLGGSASVAGDMLAVDKNASLTGEVYVRADGKKVRRVKKSTAAQPGDEVEIITRPDGTKVRRIKRAKPQEGADSGTGQSLDGFLGSPASPRKVAGSASVSGDMLHSQDAQGEIYIRADGKKVRRIKKSVASAASDDQYEIYVRADGKKVRRIKRTAENTDQTKSSSSPGSAPLAAVVESPTKALSPVEEETASQYRKMLQMGMPEGAVAQKMAADWISQNIVDAVLGPGFAVPCTSTPVPVTSAPPASAAAKSSSLSLEEEDIAVQYRKMLKMGMPEGAVAQKMAVDGIPANIVNSVLAGEVPTANAPAPPPAAPNSKVSTLSPAEEDLATQYRKMLKMGMPEGAVAQKMAVDGIAANIVDSVLAGDIPPAKAPAPSPASSGLNVSTLSPAEEDIATQYRKMLKMGMPEGAVAQKMAVDGISAEIVHSVLAGEVPGVKGPASLSLSVPVAKAPASLSPAEEDIAAQYRKMLKMGMPDGAVAQKMAVDGIAANIVDSVLAGEPSASSAPARSPTAVSMASSLSPADEEIATQYRRMLKMGMPEGAVAQKMTVDGVSQKIIDSVLRAEVSAAPVPDGMVLVPKGQATVPDGMVLVPKEQAERTIPEGMVAVPKEKAAEGIPDGYVLVPKDKVKGDPGDDLILVRKDQVRDDRDIDISAANIVSMDDLPMRMEELQKSADGSGKPRFLLQALPEDKDLEQDFIRKNLLPKSSDRGPAPAPVPARSPAPAPAPAAPSSSIAEILAQMATMGGDFDAEKMGDLLQKLESAEKRQKKLEKQLQQAGVAIAEDIDYDICIKKVEEIGKRMNEIGGSDVTHPDKEEQNRLREEYFKLEQEMEKYNNALMLTDEYQAEQDRMERKWEEDNAPGNLEALKKLRRHMAVEVRNMSEAQLTTEPTPNGKYLPQAIAKKFKRTNVLQLIRRSPDDIVRMHPSTLENMRVTGLTLTERRALYEHLRDVGPQWKAMKAEKMTERKWTWYNMMKGNFKENLASWQRHVDQYGPPGAHPYATRANPNEGCPLIGKQCPLKADKLIDYDVDDYGFPDGAVYEVSEVRKADADDPGAKAMQEALELMKEKKANERSDALKKHYQGKLLQVSKANGSCEQMDDMMDKMEFGMTKWIEDIIILGDDKSKLTEEVKKKEVASFTDVLNDCKLAALDICGRSGMQLSGKKGGDEKPDPRSIVECSLSEEVVEAFDIFTKFVNNRLKQLEILDTRIKSTVDMMKGLFAELRERNQKTISALGGERLPMSRKLKTQEDMEKEIKEKLKAAAEKDAPPEDAGGAGGGGGGPPLPGPPRGGLMDAIKGGRGGGRGGLLDAIKGGGRGRGGDGGRGGLLDAIKGGRGGGGGGRGGLLDAIKGGRGGGGDGGRGGLLDAIKGRGGGGGDGGRGGLLDAIKGRGRGAGGGGDGGRGGLLAAIKARGGD